MSSTLTKSKESLCPCHSGNAYKFCCAPFHLGELAPPEPLFLMRSRYSAYALSLIDYIVTTTHPENSSYAKPNSPEREDWIHSIAAFSAQTDFLGLEILQVQSPEELSRINNNATNPPQEKSGTVTFFAHLETAGTDISFEEKSLFKQMLSENKKSLIWLYHSSLYIKKAT